MFEHLSVGGLHGQLTSIYLLKEAYTDDRVASLINLGLHYDGNLTSDELFFTRQANVDSVRPQVLFHISPIAWTDTGPLPLQIAKDSAKDRGVIRNMFSKRRRSSGVDISS